MAERPLITPATDDARVGLLLTLADDELIMGHRLSEWTGWVPYLEADLAFSSIAQDELGHARALYRLAVSLGAASDEDALALGRAPEGYRHTVICARPNGDFANSLARQWLYDRADRVRLDALRAGSWRELTELLTVIELEETYHRAHADAWFERLVHGPIDARHRFLEALAMQHALMPSFFDAIEREPELLDAGVMTVPSAELARHFEDEIAPLLDEAGLDEIVAGEHAEMVPTAAGAVEATEPTPLGARTGRSAPQARRGDPEADFKLLWDEMTSLYRSDAEATW
jgi:ring-1,2-phenylacetyl-CoA epoxidase subunit PaaC